MLCCSVDMISKVEDRISDFNNTAIIARNPLLSFLKLWYYRGFAFLYSKVGSCADIIMVTGKVHFSIFLTTLQVNSTWTFNHIIALWKSPKKTTIVYPPCDTRAMCAFPITQKREKIILSIAQYRPEKANSQQLYTLAHFLTHNSQFRQMGVKLICIGSSRNDEDKQRAQNLRDLSVELGIQVNPKPNI